MTHDPKPLPVDRIARRKEHLMRETSAHPPRSARRMKVLVGGLLATAAIGGGTVAVAGTPAVFRQDNGMVAVDVGQLQPMHYGRAVSLGQIGDLTKAGKAKFNLNSVELGCKGVTLYVDTEADADAYGKGYSQRAKAVAARKAGQSTPATDPCKLWIDPVPELSTRR